MHAMSWGQVFTLHTLAVTLLYGVNTSLAEPPDNRSMTSTSEPHPENMSSLPSGEPTLISYAITSPEVEPEPETESEPTTEVTPEKEPFSEPQPDWGLAKKKWSWAWEFHIYTFGVLFGLLALYSLVSAFRLYRRKQLLSRKYFLTLNTLIFLITVLRCIYLLVDAYNSRRTFPIFVSYMLYNIPLVSLTSVFSLLFFALLQTLQMTFISTKIQKLRYLIFIILVHFVLSTVTDLIVGLLSTAEVLIIICQAIFVVWGLFLFCGFIFIFKQLYQFARRRQAEDEKLAHSYKSKTNNHVMNNAHKLKNSRHYTLSLAVVATLITSIFGLVIVGLQLYAMFGIFSIGSGKPTPWQYWGFMTAFRLVEFCMSGLVSYIATQPFRYYDRNCFNSTLCGNCCDKARDHADGCDETYLVTIKEDGTPIKVNYISDDAVPLCEKPDLLDSSRRPSSLLVSDNGYVRIRETLESDSIKFIDDESSHSQTSFDSNCREALLNESVDYDLSRNVDKSNDTEMTECNDSQLDDPESSSKQFANQNNCLEKPVINVSCFENNLAEQVKPRGRLNRTPALDDSSHWEPDISRSGDIPVQHSNHGSTKSIERGTSSDAEEVPRVKYRLKQRHPLMQRSSSEGGPLPGAGHLTYASSSDSGGDVPPVDRDELAKSTDLSEFNQDVENAMASLLDNSSEEFIETEVDV